MRFVSLLADLHKLLIGAKNTIFVRLGLNSTAILGSTKKSKGQENIINEIRTIRGIEVVGAESCY